MKACLTFVLALSLTCPAFAEDVFRVGLFTPHVSFRDGVERKAFVDDVAKALTARMGTSWVGEAYAREQDFEERLDALDLVIIDVDYFVRARSLTPVASGSRKGETALPLELLVRRGESDALSDLRGKNMVLPAGTRTLQSFITGDVLRAEMDAADFFGEIAEVKDARAALGAVELGRADVTLVYAGAGDGLHAVLSTSPVPLPIAAITDTGRLSADAQSSVKETLRGLRISSGPLDGFAAFDREGLQRYDQARKRKKTRKRLSTVDAAPPRAVRPAKLDIPDSKERWESTPVGDLLVLPKELR